MQRPLLLKVEEPKIKHLYFASLQLASFFPGLHSAITQSVLQGKTGIVPNRKVSGCLCLAPQMCGHRAQPGLPSGGSLSQKCSETTSKSSLCTVGVGAGGVTACADALLPSRGEQEYGGNDERWGVG